MTEPVVLRALLGLAEHRIGFGRFLEALFGLLVARIAIGMVFQRLLPVGALDFLLAGRAFDDQDFVIVADRHACATLTCAARNEAPPRAR